MKDVDKLEHLSYKQLNQLYNKYFSLGYLNTDINAKLALISLIGYIVKELKKKNRFVDFIFIYLIVFFFIPFQHNSIFSV